MKASSLIARKAKGGEKTGKLGEGFILGFWGGDK